jgi:SynChlorMet cassette radical SAM/SPASM protein ScmE
MSGVIRTPRKVDIDITNRCNLRCDYCYHFSSEGDVRGDLPTDEWLRFFDELGNCAVMNVTLAGGEPFTRPDLFELIDGIVRNRMRFSILSNGTLIDEDRAARLARTGRCDAVQVSIDGSCAKIHESCRGNGSFEKTVEAVRILQDHRIPVAVRVTIHHRNVDDLENIARFLLEDLGLPSFSTNAASYLGLCRTHTDTVSLTIEDRVTAMRTLRMLNNRYGCRIGAQAGPLADARDWAVMLERSRTGAVPTSTGGFLSSCGCSRSGLAVRADGVYVPCPLLPMIELGRINRDPLVDVWRHHPELLRLRERGRIPLSEFDECRECIYLPSCRGGCPGLSASVTGDPYQPAADVCLRRFLAEGGSVPCP